ncbi:MAG TPA: 50S ribosomal protein L31 [Alphaproteobacteria bacterium]|nr:50S ribosomal protein L31 [Alphaproteobacteria bacterium]
MKKDIHPAYHFVEVQMTDGTKFITRTTWGSENEKLQLVIDPKNHPAYTGERKVVDAMGRMEKFARKYGIQGAKAETPAAE